MPQLLLVLLMKWFVGFLHVDFVILIVHHAVMKKAALAEIPFFKKVLQQNKTALLYEKAI